MESTLSKIYKSPVGNAVANTFFPTIAPVVNGLAGFFKNKTQSLPNDAGSYQSPAPAQQSAPVLPASGGTPTPGPGTPSSSGSPASSEDLAYLANAMRSALGNGPKGDYNTYAANIYGPTVAQANTDLLKLNNSRNDLATDPSEVQKLFNVPSDFALNPEELRAITKASAGIYEPALKVAAQKIAAAQDRMLYGQRYGYDSEDSSLTADEIKALTDATKGIYGPALDTATAKMKSAQLRELYREKYGYDSSYANPLGPKGDGTAADGTPWKAIYGNPTIQQKLEKDYSENLLAVVHARSGDLGVQNTKISQAIHLQSLIDQMKDPKTGAINLSGPQYEEVVIGLANLLSGTSSATDSSRSGLMQGTFQGDVNKALNRITGGVRNASSQQIYAQLQDSLKRQGEISEDLRNQYLDSIGGMAPTDLDPGRKQKVFEGLNLPSYKTLLENGSTSTKTPAAAASIAPAVQDVIQFKDGTKYKKNPDGTYDPVTAFNTVDGDTKNTAIKIPQSSHLAYVNNNPGNLRFAPWQTAYGAQPGTGGFAKFPDGASGMRALEVLTDSRARQGHTIGSYIALYAPPSENDTRGYIQGLQRSTGLSPDTKLSQLSPAQKEALNRAIAYKESSTVFS